MGFSLKKAVKSVTKPVQKAVNAVGKIATGNVAEGLGDIGQNGLGMYLDVVTWGNKDKVDALSGGGITSAEGASRGNSSDIIRTGATIGASYIGGPAAAMQTNSILANGGSVQDVGLAYATGLTPGGDMSFLTDVNDFLKSNSALSDLAKQTITSFSSKPKPPAAPAEAAVSVMASPQSNSNIYLMIGGGVLFLGLIFALVFNRRGK